MSKKNQEMNAFIDALMKRMTIAQKVGQMNLLTPGGGVATGASVNSDVEEKISKGLVGAMFGINDFNKILQTQKMFVESETGIPAFFGSDLIHAFKYPVYPLNIGLANSHDPDLHEKMARNVAEQGSAEGLTWNFFPMVEVARDPRWGRVSEFGVESPFLAALLTTALVKGVQGDDLSAIDTMMACLKHLVGYSKAEGGRDYDLADMSAPTLHDIYMAPFDAGLDAGAASVMAAFNSLAAGGPPVPCHANHELLTEYLRKYKKFMGFVTADYTGEAELGMSGHRLGGDQTVAEKALRAGLDMDMVGESCLKLIKSYYEGRVSEAEIDRPCRLILEAKYKLGLFDDPYRYLNAVHRDTILAKTPEYEAFALESAIRSNVLLENDSILPLNKTDTIAVMGPAANSSINMSGPWVPTMDKTRKCVSFLKGIKNIVNESAHVFYAKGANYVDYPEIAKRLNVFADIVADKTARQRSCRKIARISPCSPEAMIEEAVKNAARSDVAVICVGETKEHSGEASSLMDTSLPENQVRLVKAVIATGKPCVIVISSGRPLDITKMLEAIDAARPPVKPSIIWAPHGGSMAGHALAKQLFGDANFSAKLAMTWPQLGQIPQYEERPPSGRPMPRGEIFRKFTNPAYLDATRPDNGPIYRLLHGKSYTVVEYSDVRIDNKNPVNKDVVTASVNIRNAGTHPVHEIVPLFIEQQQSDYTRPVRVLQGIKIEYLRPGESKIVNFQLTTKNLEFSIARGIAKDKRIWEAGEYRIGIGPHVTELKYAAFTWHKKGPRIKNQEQMIK